jgi:hypothetical protein
VTAATDPGPREVERVMEELVYEHLIDLVDFDRMSSLEQVVGLQLYELHAKGQLGDSGDEAGLAERAAAIIERAWHRIIDDPRRYLDARETWQPDEDCELCRRLAGAGGDTEPSDTPQGFVSAAGPRSGTLT